MNNYLETNNMTLKNFLESLGIGKSSFQNYLHKNATPSVTTAIKIAKKLNTTVEKLWQ